MARQSKRLVLQNSIALIVDGKDEKWYIEEVKRRYPCSKFKKMKIKPDLAAKKKVEDLFNFAKQKSEGNDGFSKIFLIIDMDSILKEASEFERFKVYYEKYIGIKRHTLSTKKISDYKWMEKLTLIINNPCLEFWYLLHHKKTNKFYQNFNAMEKDLKKVPNLQDYEKSEKYYKEKGSIYDKLKGEIGISTACSNAEPFDIGKVQNMGGSEMYKLFEFFPKDK